MTKIRLDDKSYLTFTYLCRKNKILEDVLFMDRLIIIDLFRLEP